jgi:hypothetical protein
MRTAGGMITSGRSTGRRHGIVRRLVAWIVGRTFFARRVRRPGLFTAVKHQGRRNENQANMLGNAAHRLPLLLTRKNVVFHAV